MDNIRLQRPNKLEPIEIFSDGSRFSSKQFKAKKEVTLYQIPSKINVSHHRTLSMNNWLTTVTPSNLSMGQEFVRHTRDRSEIKLRDEINLLKLMKTPASVKSRKIGSRLRHPKIAFSRKNIDKIKIFDLGSDIDEDDDYIFSRDFNNSHSKYSNGIDSLIRSNTSTLERLDTPSFVVKNRQMSSMQKWDTRETSDTSTMSVSPKKNIIFYKKVNIGMKGNQKDITIPETFKRKLNWAYLNHAISIDDDILSSFSKNIEERTVNYNILARPCAESQGQLKRYNTIMSRHRRGKPFFNQIL